MSRLSLACLLLALAACGRVDLASGGTEDAAPPSTTTNTSTSALDLAALPYCGLVTIDAIADNLSGLAVDPADGSLLLVVNKLPLLARYYPWNATLSPLADVRDNVTDSEGLAWLGTNPATGRDEIAASQEADADDHVPGQRVVVFDAVTLAPTGESYHLAALVGAVQVESSSPIDSLKASGFNH
jgi:hypothetical protein